MSAEDEGRTEEATGKQREKFRDEGSIARSQELMNLVHNLAGYAVLSAFGAGIVESMGNLFVHSFTMIPIFRVDTGLEDLKWYSFEVYIKLMAPIFIALMVAAFAVSIFQAGWHVSWKAVTPKFQKINPFTNFKKVMISKQALVELGKSVMKILLLGVIIYAVVRPVEDEFGGMMMFTPVQIGLITWEYAMSVWLVVIFFLVVLGAGDYMWAKRKLEETMKMTKQQVKDELKNSQGDQQIKAKQRAFGFELLRKVISQRTAKADVIITNPTHFAVAINYQHGKMSAPLVVAKGADHIALRMRKIARQSNVPIVENRQLARALYYSCEMGDEIPERLFRPVAEILAFIYRLNQQKGAG